MPEKARAKRPAESPGADRRLVRRLLPWFARHKRDLPWRKTTDPYALWISEVMLQQTTVNAVVPYYGRWLKTFPNVSLLARAPLRRVLKAWEGLGYYSRARNLHAAAKMIVKRHGGRLPSDADSLGALPGFGDYTTAAVLSIAFHKPIPLVDANVRRVLMRVFGMEGPAAAAADKPILGRLTPLVPMRKPGIFNEALMELGALVCRPRNPLCLVCPLQADCRAFAEGRQEVIPAPRQRSYRRVTAVIGVIESGGRVLIQKRPEKGLLASLWEFPGGKARPGESLRTALAREIREETGAEVASARPLMTVDHSYTNHLVTLHAFEARLAGEPRLDPRRRRWVRLSDLRQYPFPSGSAKIVDKLLKKR